MKNIFVILAAILFIPVVTFAQADTTKVKYTEESADKSDFKLKETYNYLIRAQVEEKSLFKIGICGFGFSGSGSQLRDGYLTYGIGIEHKIKPSFSVLADFRHTLEYNNPFGPAKYSFNVGARYYYNIEARIRKGKSANNFSANYLGIYQQNMLIRRLPGMLPKGNENYIYQSNLNFLYGIQRQISKYGYVDFGFGPVLQNSSFRNRISFNALFSIGLAL